ncbi:MAG: chaperone protein DnaK [Planctomycetaceae bacterium]|nr:MAG: chaperone protein DnaK [Planctomycetaceae bacterium]
MAGTATAPPIGIDLGTTYSSIAYLDRQGVPHCLTMKNGECSIPSVVMLTEEGTCIVGELALDQALIQPQRVIKHPKRKLGERDFYWTIDGQRYTPLQVSSWILSYLLKCAQRDLKCPPIEYAVISIPAQFNEVQREATVQAGYRAGLKKIDLINEPVAATLCYLLGDDGMHFREVAQDERLLVADLGGGTYDLSLVHYRKDDIRVLATGGDPHLGGLDWNAKLLDLVLRKYRESTGIDLQTPEHVIDLQRLHREIEVAKRKLSTEERVTIVCGTSQKIEKYQITRRDFENLCQDLLERARQCTTDLLKQANLGWAHINTRLAVGGASRMPMFRAMLKQLAGRTVDTSVSPDQSIALGAALQAGILLLQRGHDHVVQPSVARKLKAVRQHVVNARPLGILVRDPHTQQRLPHYLLPANTPLPAERHETVGTVVDNQLRAHLRIIEGGIPSQQRYVEIGTCVIDPLPPGLPAGAEIQVTLRYDDQARVHISARIISSGQTAEVAFIRQENLLRNGHQVDGHGQDEREVVRVSPRSNGPTVVPPKLPGNARSLDEAIQQGEEEFFKKSTLRRGVPR